MVPIKFQTFLTELHADKAGHSGRTLYEHLSGTYDLLRAWNNPTPICSAGLFHSIYGTWNYRHRSFPIEERAVIRDLIGTEAERLVYIFCATERPKAFLTNSAESEILLKDHFKNEVIRLMPPELSALLEIEAANLLEQGEKRNPILTALENSGISAAAKAEIRRRRASAVLHFKRTTIHDIKKG